MKEILAATNNGHKLEELRAVLAPRGVSVVSLRDRGIEIVPDETGVTFEENALIKARAIRKAAGGCAVLADDSGLCVDALDGAPGVVSAVYAGDDASDEENTAKLLREMEGMENRRGRFVCVLAYIDENGEEKLFRGECEGEILREMSGGKGFGYDPVFRPVGSDVTFAEMSEEAKNGMSHRGMALRQLAVSS